MAKVAKDDLCLTKDETHQIQRTRKLYTHDEFYVAHRECRKRPNGYSYLDVMNKMIELHGDRRPKGA